MAKRSSTLVLTLTVLGAPHVQVMLGNGMGMVGWLFSLSLLVVAGLHLVTLQAYTAIYQPGSQGGEYGLLRGRYGDFLALASGLASRLGLLASGGTVALVTAGYLFNEVFVYWFANFGFAFLVLGLVVTVHLAGQAWALWLQKILVWLMLVLLAVLVAASLGQLPGPAPQAEGIVNSRGLLLPFMMIIGLEFAFMGRGRPQQGRVGQLLFALMLIFVVWGVVMRQFLPAAKLAESFNPQMIAARKVLGQPGRLLLGAALIAGSAALVNGLIYGLRSQLAEAFSVNGKAGEAGQSLWNNALIVLALAGGPALMMASGMAGEDAIDLYLRAALLFWLLHYSLVHFAVGQTGVCRPWLHGLAGLVFGMAAIGLAWSDPAGPAFIRCLAVIALLAGAMGLILYYLKQRVTRGGTP